MKLTDPEITEVVGNTEPGEITRGGGKESVAQKTSVSRT